MGNMKGGINIMDVSAAMTEVTPDLVEAVVE